MKLLHLNFPLDTRIRYLTVMTEMRALNAPGCWLRADNVISVSMAFRNSRWTVGLAPVKLAEWLTWLSPHPQIVICHVREVQGRPANSEITTSSHDCLPRPGSPGPWRRKKLSCSDVSSVPDVQTEAGLAREEQAQSDLPKLSANLNATVINNLWVSLMHRLSDLHSGSEEISAQ